MKRKLSTGLLFFFITIVHIATAQSVSRVQQSFNSGWKFYLGDAAGAERPDFDDAQWRKLDLPHDWSIELPFDKDSPTGNGGGALRGGTGWYRKTFVIPVKTAADRKVYIEFDGVYRNSEVWINGNYLGKRPNGYISFNYDITPYLKYGNEKNIIAVKADNSEQPNSRWYSGSGIFRNVWLLTKNEISIDQWGSFVTTPNVTSQSANVNLGLTLCYQPTVVRKADHGKVVSIRTRIYDQQGKQVADKTSTGVAVSPFPGKDTTIVKQQFVIGQPRLWSVDKPSLYKAVTQILLSGKVIDEYTTSFGIRYFEFDIDKGFLLNGKPLKILGVCNHHDLGCLGTAINKSALRRQLQILKDMGCNGIRTSHNPPAPELLDLCDEMGFIVMDEAFDMWKIAKNKYDYHLDWDEWHVRDLRDQVLRDRNHPSIFIWSIGNEVMEQWERKENSGAVIAKELASIVRSLETTRPITAACNSPYPENPVIKSGALDLVGYNYEHNNFPSFHQRFPGKKFIATETVSALATRGHYDMPSDSVRKWPARWDSAFTKGNPDTTCSAYDNCRTPWGSTHEDTWKILKKYDFLSGMYIWTGFDYIGEPTPYPWPARSSYFGIIDLAGFPKDVYYMYQSEWTNKPVLHILPHWNWKSGEAVDVWAYYNNADEVELFLNGRSLGVKKKEGDQLHVWWRVNYEPGTIKAVSRKNGKVVLSKEIKTAGAPARVILEADRKLVNAKNDELCFVTVKIVDKDGNLVPDADNLVQFFMDGGSIAGVDNGSETSMESFKANNRKAFNGLCLAVLRPNAQAGAMTLTATSKGLQLATVTISVK